MFILYCSLFIFLLKSLDQLRCFFLFEVDTLENQEEEDEVLERVERGGQQYLERRPLSPEQEECQLELPEYIYDSGDEVAPEEGEDYAERIRYKVNSAPLSLDDGSENEGQLDEGYKKNKFD